MAMINNTNTELRKKPKTRLVYIHTVIIPTTRDNSEAVVVVEEVVVVEVEEDDQEEATAEVFLEEHIKKG